MMRQKPCTLICLLLCLALSVAGIARGVAGVAMAQAMGTSQIVICGSNGPEMITLNAAGQAVPMPAKACAECPDCALVQGFFPSFASAPPGVDGPVRLASLPLPLMPAVLRVLQSQPARGPPTKAL